MSHTGSRVQEIYFGQIFLYNSAMTLTIDLETWFKVTSYVLLKGTVWVKYEPYWARGEKICSGQEISNGQADGRTD